MLLIPKSGISPLFGLALALFIPSFAAEGATPALKPNIIYILADDLGYGDLSFLGQYNHSKNPDSPIQLYDLSKDKSEKNDVAADFPEVVQELSKIMKEAHTDSEIFPFKRQ